MIEKKDSYSTLVENVKLKKLFFLLFFIVAFSLLYIYRLFFWPFIFALIFYIALRPLYDKVTGYIKGRLVSSALLVIFLFLIVIVPLFFLLLSLADQVYEFYLFMQQNYNYASLVEIIKGSSISKIIYQYFNIEEGKVLQQIADFLKNSSFQIFSNLTAVLTFSINLSVNIFFMLLILFFLFKDGYKLEESFYKILPFPDDIERSIVERLKQVIKVLLAGNIIIMILQGLAIGFGFFIFGIGMPLLGGSIAAISSLIPVVGTAFIWAPACIYLIFSGDYLSAVLFSSWCLFWYLLLENFLKPKFFGTRLNFHPLLFFFLLLGSIQVFNLPGLIIGPILLALFFSLWEIYKILNDSNAGSE